MNRAPTLRAIAPIRTSLVGREHEVQAIAGLLQRADIRVVTVIGPVGIGKTVVAEAACRRLAAQTPLPVQTIALQGGAGPAVREALAAALSGASAEAGPHPPPMPSGRRRIVLIDGAEMSPDAAQAVSTALDEDSGLAVLATSVVPLGVRGEHLVRLGSLGAPEDGSRDVAEIGASPAVQLFCARLAAADPDFEFDASNAVAVAELCTRLDGHPLALELAVARCATATVASVLEHLKRTSALVVLKQHGCDVAPRHRSLRDTIEWSVGLLDDAERALLRRACVFAGSFTRDALLSIAAAASGAPADTDAAAAIADCLDVLVATGTVRRVEAPCGGEEDRYVIPAAVHDYVVQLDPEPGEIDQLRRSHTAYYRGLARRAASQQWSAEHGRATRQLVAEQQELRQAFDEVRATNDVAAALAFAVELEALWIGTGGTETAANCLTGLLDRARTTSAASTPDALVAEAAASLAALTLWSRHAALDTAHRARLAEAEALAHASGRPDLVLRTRVTELQTQILVGDLDEARSTADDAIRMATALAHDWWRMRFLSLSSATANQAGDASLAVEHAVAARDLARAIGDDHQLVLTSHVLTGIPGADKDRLAAVPSPDDVLAMARRLGDVQVEGMVLISTAIRHARTGDVAAAVRDLRAALNRGRRSGFWYLEELALFVLVPIAAAAGRREDAARLSGALHDVLTDTRRRMPPGPVAAYDAALETTREVLGAKAYDHLAAGGRLLRWSEALEHADALLASLDPVSLRAQDNASGSGPGESSAPSSEYPYRLTHRELDVLRHLSSGASNKDIAHALGLRAKTVMHYTGTIYRKLGVRSRTEAVTVAWNAGLLEPPAHL